MFCFVFAHTKATKLIIINDFQGSVLGVFFELSLFRLKVEPYLMAQLYLNNVLKVVGGWEGKTIPIIVRPISDLPCTVNCLLFFFRGGRGVVTKDSDEFSITVITSESASYVSVCVCVKEREKELVVCMCVCVRLCVRESELLCVSVCEYV